MSHPTGIKLVKVPAISDTKADVDIIAIHGMDTDSTKTWTWIPKDGGPSAPKSLEELARDLLATLEDHLRRHRPATDAPPRPILFIASCFGGILLLKTLVISSNNNTKLLETTAGVIFLATPFQGTSFEKVAKWAKPILGLWAVSRYREPTPLLRLVEDAAPEIDTLVRDFTHLCKDRIPECQVFTFYELHNTNLLTRVKLDFINKEELLVDKTSVTLQIVKLPQGLERPHVLMNKFPHSGDGCYNLVRQKIEKFLDNIRSPLSILRRADEQIRNVYKKNDRLIIDRLSGDPLPMEQCYINLALVEQQRADNSKHTSKKPTPQPSPFSLSERLKLGPSHEDLLVKLPKLFEPSKLPDGDTKAPRRILIRGRAGVGETTLCKKIVHDFIHKNMWQDLFNRVIWVRLRDLKSRSYNEYNLGAVLKQIFFQKSEGSDSLHQELGQHIEHSGSGDTLFLLDGLDEVTELADEHRHGTPHPGHEFLIRLLNRPNVIITTRPHAAFPVGFNQPDLELDTVGFNQDQVQKYIKTVMPNFKDVEAIQSYLQKNRLMQSLVQIPILLDALCFIWEASSTRNGGPKVVPETMTAVYEGIALNLWEKDLERLEKDERLTGNPSRAQTQDAVSNESSTLEHLAFSGLYSDVIEFQPGHRDATYRHIKQHKQYNTKLSLHEMYGRLSFLRTSDTSADPSGQSFHFIHLTFQEYFAAKYFVQKWENNENLEYIDFKRPKRNLTKISPESFLQEHKYTVRYDIMWRFVAGLLDAPGEDETTRFFEAIERKPVDLLGPTHQWLVMHCLYKAASLPNDIRANREERLTQWVLFKNDFTGSSTFVRESELPEQVLRTALSASRDKRILLQALWYSRRYLSETTVMALVELFKDESWYVRRSAADALGNQPSLSETTVTALVELFKDESGDVRGSAAYTLGNQPSLIDKILGALGLELQSETHNRNLFRNFQYLEPLYGSLLRRSFNEGFSLYYNEDRCIINQTSGVRMAALKEDLFQSIILKGQRGVREVCPSKLWGRFEEDDSYSPSSRYKNVP
ncbi:peptidase C14 [Colletotrichum musicola]|uniref:Peptidase C14 n=1 Tax=Colletotrichum musicola TaxID=2175873 RepID=A0A8H6KD93_9PEZI|nr:peptidase C14 [Colletotrichum musicola]